MKKDDYIQVCPKCDSIDIEHDFSQPALVAGGIFSYKCNNCGHIANVFPEIHVKDLHKPRNPKEIKDKQLQTVQFGKGFIGIFRVAAPVGILFSILLLSTIENKWLGIFIISFFTALTILAYDNEIHEHPTKRKLLGFLITIGIIFTLLI